MLNLKTLTKKLLFLLTGGGIFYYLGHLIWVNWREVAPRLAAFDRVWGGVAVIFGLLHFTFCVLIWEVTLNKLLVENLPIGKGFRIWSVSQLGRYIPGNVWAVIGRMQMCRQENIPHSKTAVSIYLEMILVIAAACILFLAGLPFWPALIPRAQIWLLVALIPLLLLSVHPKIVEGLLNRLLIWKKQSPVKINLGWEGLSQLLFLGILNWLISGAAIYSLIRAIQPLSWSAAPILGGIIGISWLFGVMAIFIPSGIGVREGVMTWLLSYHLPLPLASLTAILARLLFLLVEVIFLAVVMVLTREKNN
ncbi:MAG: flippase-like domain-containing protein [Candidatus Schekmanbacteria bacterium]|nr:flippase-like domain-containing protein [Candidatus Schekmanbacteria bacterium]